VPVTLNSWILAFHLLSAAALVGAMTLFSILIVANWRADRPATIASYMRVAMIGNVLVGVGTVGTIVFGVWLAISVDGYAVWDGWVLAALVLWAIATELGRRAGTAYTEAGNRAAELAKAGNEPSPELARSFGPTPALRFHVASTVLILLILIDMIWKPGA
jgi:uncharacterized membrane protein